jgi:hypothetical protein
MSESTLASFGAVAVVALLALLSVHFLRRWATSTTSAWFIVVALVLAGVVGIYFVDASIPLIESHFRPGGEPAPAWVALLAFGVRFAALFALLYLGPWSPRRKTHD